MSSVVILTVTFEHTIFLLLHVIEHFHDICSEFFIW
jgi:hypothetical protein